jgi:hypothetical protein
MSERDDKLEKKLQALEGGEPVEQIMDEGESAKELGSLIHLAKSIREMSHPELSRQAIEAEKKRLVSAAREKKRARYKKRGAKVGGFTGQWLFVPAFAGLALILLMVFILATGVGIYFAGPLGAQYATLTDVSGQIQVADSGRAGEWDTVADGERVRSGQRIQTGPESWATLVFFDGTKTTLAPETDLMLSEIDGSWGDVLQVTLIQNEGQTDHQVVPFDSENAGYYVFTPTGTASVRGTDFRVLVADTGKSLFSVSTGQVLVNNEGSQALLNAGQGVVSELGKPLVSPTYLFALQGELQSKEGRTWTVEGASFRVKGSTVVESGLQVGDEVLVQGRIWKNGWIADSVHGALGDFNGGEYSGMVEQQDGNLWVVGGFDLQITSNPDNIKVGDFVHVSFEVLENGTWNALEIVLLDGAEETPDAGSEDEPVEEGLSFSPDKFELSACESIPEMDATLTYGEGGDPLELINVVLEIVSEDLPESVEEILVEPSEFTMEPGDSVGFTVNLTLAGELTSLPEDSKVEFKVVASSELEEVELEIELKCEVTTEEEDEQAKDEATCTGNDRHPKALKLEDEFEDLDGLKDINETVNYVRIMNWFCINHFGFGEIDQMVNLAARYGVPIDDIFDMRDEEGLGWGQIKQDLAANDPDSQQFMNPAGKVPPGKIKSEEKKNKDKPNKKDDD